MGLTRRDFFRALGSAAIVASTAWSPLSLLPVAKKKFRPYDYYPGLSLTIGADFLQPGEGVTVTLHRVDDDGNVVAREIPATVVDYERGVVFVSPEEDNGS